MWLIKIARENPWFASNMINRHTAAHRGVPDDLETFFHHQRFMPAQDLMQVKTIEDLKNMVLGAKDEIHAAQEKKQYLDAKQGTEVFRDDDKWFIAALHNKGAACEHGKNTDWCTAAPGLDYFSDYYDEFDPLFYFGNKKNLNKYQFHYGTEQFMDRNDHPVNEDTFEFLHNLLKQTEAYESYSIIREHEFERLSRDPQADEEEFGKMLGELENPVQSAMELAVRSSTAPHLLSWLAESEYASDYNVAHALVVNEYTSTYALARLARNHSDDRIRHQARDAYNHRMRDDISLGIAQPLHEHFKRFL